MTTPSKATATFWDHATLWADDYSLAGHTTDGGKVRGITRLRYAECDHYDCQPVVVIDPEDRREIQKILVFFCRAAGISVPTISGTDHLQAALREFATPTRIDEPTDATARVTDHRENIWRLLADGDWVCTSGPDIGEYLVWDRLSSERGPLTVEVTQ